MKLVEAAVSMHKDLIRMTRKKCGNIHDAEDIVQDLYVVLLILDTKKIIVKPRQYILGAMYNLIRQRWQLSKARLTSMLRFIYEFDEKEVCSPEQSLAALSEAMNLLSFVTGKRRLEAMELNLLGYSQKEIATMMVISENAVEGFIWRGNKELKNVIRQRSGASEEESRKARVALWENRERPPPVLQP